MIRTFFSSFAGKLLAALVLAILAAIGFGPDTWVQALVGWLADPLQFSLTAARLIAVSLCIATGVLLAWPYVWPRLRNVVRPKKFKAEFDPFRDIHRNVETGVIRSTCVLVHVTGNDFVRCSGRITSLEKLSTDKKVLSSLQGTRDLRWSPQEDNKTIADISPSVPGDLDIFRSIDGSDRLILLSVNHPPTWVSFFDLESGLYRITINISGGNGWSEDVRLLVDWRGKWNDFDVEREE